MDERVRAWCCDPVGDQRGLFRAHPGRPPGKLRQAALILHGLARVQPEQDGTVECDTVEEPLSGDHDAGRKLEVVIDLWPCNAESLAAFQLCTISGIGAGMGGIVWTGIAATEVRAAVALAGVRPANRWQVAADVLYLGNEIAGERNRRAEAKAQRKG